MEVPVRISFDCLPLRTIGRLDIPLDASPKYRARLERIQVAMRKHGQHNAYYLYNARCRFQLTNDPAVGMLEFLFRGTVLTDEHDQQAALCDLQVELIGETCEWITEPAVAFFQETVRRAVRVEFDRYIKAGNLSQTIKRLEQLQADSDQMGGYLGMYL
jgi:hypothetical protein